MPNHLVNETSPYLRQHQHNPVDWYPWGEPAITRARAENKPIFLSIGYSACHWCHVMAHESFEAPEIANILNQHFISIKVDREERPDLDDVYMQAVVMMTGQGGWPMSVFLTPALEPFFGGTYFPPEPRYGMPSFRQVLLSVASAWLEKSKEIANSAQQITESIKSQFAKGAKSKEDFNFKQIIETLNQSYDWQYGGWGNAPKFPPAMLIEFLLQQAWQGDQQSTQMATHLLNRMALGGMYDLVGGGFHRYSVDLQWLVPHFEKMLYDNALLALAYLHGFAISGNPNFGKVAISTLEFIRDELTAPGGGFYSSLDADTPQGEGRFYTWRLTTLKSSLSESEFDLLERTMVISPQGNFEEGLNIIRLKDDINHLADEMELSFESLYAKLEPLLKKLSEQRAKRQTPEKDTKIIVSWNTLAIRAFINAGLLLGREDFISIGRHALDFILEEMVNSNGQLNRVWHEGKANQPGTLSDYAGLILSCHALYEVDFSPQIYETMKDLFGQLQTQFAPDKIYYYDSSSDIEHLIARPSSLQDNAIPSGNALVANVYWLFWNYENDNKDQEQIEEMLGGIAGDANHNPNHFGYWLQIADRHHQKTSQIALVTENSLPALQPFLNRYHRTYHPNSVIAVNHAEINNESDLPNLLEGRTPVQNQPTAYVCQSFTCFAPVTNVEEFGKRISRRID